jgi:DNA primase
LWLCHCYNEDCLSTYQRQKALYDMVYDDIGNGRRLPPDPILKGTRPSRALSGVRPAAEVVYALHMLPPDHPANVYLRSRGYDPAQLSSKLRVGYCYTAYYDFRIASDRIIIPIYFADHFVGWQARSVGEPAGGAPKYYSMPGMRKNEILYNYDEARKYSFVVICEGPTDVWRVGPPAVALLGKTMSTAQRHLIAAGWGKGAAVVLLDGDARADARRIHDALGDLVRDRVLVELPEDKDPGDFAAEDLWRLIYETARQKGVTLFKERASQ